MKHIKLFESFLNEGKVSSSPAEELFDAIVKDVSSYKKSFNGSSHFVVGKSDKIIVIDGATEFDEDCPKKWQIPGLEAAKMLKNMGISSIVLNRYDSSIKNVKSSGESHFAIIITNKLDDSNYHTELGTFIGIFPNESFNKSAIKKQIEKALTSNAAMIASRMQGDNLSTKNTVLQGMDLEDWSSEVDSAVSEMQKHYYLVLQNTKS
jgi:hypothetical protein